MVKIAKLEQITVPDMSVKYAGFSDSPDMFDKWYKLVREKYPEATRINCSYSKLQSLDVPGAIKIHCDKNELRTINAPDAKVIDCPYNQLRTLNAPMATKICCYNNQLESIIAPNVVEIICHNNPNLKFIHAPKLKMLRFNSDAGTEIPDSKDIEIYDQYANLLIQTEPGVYIIDE